MHESLLQTITACLNLHVTACTNYYLQSNLTILKNYFTVFIYLGSRKH